MSTETENNPQTDRSRSMWIVTGGVVLLGTLAVFSYSVPDRDQAASGAPLYDQAVKEALRGLRNPGTRAQPAGAGRPALPANLSAKDHYWCENCKAWHKKQAPGDPQAPQANPAAESGTTPPPAAPRVVIPYALGMAPGDPQPAAASIPALPDGLSPAEHYWCENCKAWHKRDASAAAHSPDTPPPAQPDGAIPPLPDGLSPAEHYWCDKCKTWHKRPETKPTP